MTPGARLAAAIDLLDLILAAARDGGAAADTLAQRYFKTRRYAGSGDRRAIRNLTWTAIRAFGERPVSGRAAFVALAEGDPALAALFSGEGHAPAPIDRAEPRATPAALPAWITPLLDPRIGQHPHEVAALLDRAPLDIRINPARADGVALPVGAPLPPPLSGLRLPHDTAVQDSKAWHAGAIEVQDAGSQWIVAATAARPGMTVVDLCAGAGGKTLGVAAAMAGQGRIIATDTDRHRLQQLPPRAERAGAAIIETRLLNPRQESAMLADLTGSADVVLVDAPCSGSGTWRRNPEARWRLTPDRLDRLAAEQARLLDIATALVAPGGVLVYAVCALTSVEGEGQFAAMLDRHPDFVAEPAFGTLADPPGYPAGAGRLLTPAHDMTDGFFMARARRRDIV